MQSRRSSPRVRTVDLFHHAGLCVAAAALALALPSCTKKKKSPDANNPMASSVDQPTLNLFGFEESYIHRINFNVQQRGRLILVHYDPAKPHDIAIVDCPVSTKYEYMPSEAKGVETLRIRSMGELDAHIPMGIMRFGGYLKAGSELEFNYATVGSYQVTDDPVVPAAEGPCARATHYVAALSVGAFSFVEHRGGEGGASAQVGAVGPKVAVHAERERGATRSWGDLAACDREDPKGCRTPTQMLLLPIPDGAVAATESGEPARPADPPPTTDAPVDGHVITLRIDENDWRPGHHMGLALQKTLSFAQYFEEATTFGFDDRTISVLGGFLDDEGLSISRPLVGGRQYAVFATASADVDIDLAILDGAGNPVALDNEDDAQPLVSFTPPQDGVYSLLVAPGKKGTQVFAAVGVMVEEGGYRVAPELLQRVYQGLLDAGGLASRKVAEGGAGAGLHFHAGQREWSLMGTFMEPGSSISISDVHLQGPSVVLSTAHDAACDLDLEVRDRNGHVWADRENDSAPLVVVDTQNAGAPVDMELTYKRGDQPTLGATLILAVE